MVVGLLSAVFAIRFHRRLHFDPDDTPQRVPWWLDADNWWMQAGGTSAITWAAMSIVIAYVSPGLADWGRSELGWFGILFGLVVIGWWGFIVGAGVLVWLTLALLLLLFPTTSLFDVWPERERGPFSVGSILISWAATLWGIWRAILGQPNWLATGLWATATISFALAFVLAER